MRTINVYTYLKTKNVKIEKFLYLTPIFILFDLSIAFFIFIFLVFIFLLLNLLIFSPKEIKLPDLIIWFLLLLWGIYVAFASPKLNDGILYYSLTIFSPFLLFFVIQNIKINDSFLNNLFIVFFFSGILLSFYSIFIFSISGFDTKLRIPSLWEHYNLVAAVFMVLFMFNLSFIINSSNRKGLLLKVLSLIIILLGLILTQTRGVWVATIISIMIFIIRKPKLIFPVLISTSILLIGFYSTIQTRLATIVNFSGDISTLGRLQAWLTAIELLKQNFLFGHGFNSYIYLRDTVFSNYFVLTYHSHNTYLSLMLELGFFGFLLYFSFYIKAFIYNYQIKKNDNYINLRRYTDGIELSFIGLFVAFMFEPYFTVNGSTTILIWFLISLAYRFKWEPNNNLHQVQENRLSNNY